MREALSKYFSLVSEFLSKSRSLILFATCIFLLGLAMGLGLFRINEESANRIAQVVIDKVQSMDEATKDMSIQGRTLMIFWNNLRVVLICFATGVLLGIIPTLMLFFNGLFLGVIFGMMGEQGINIVKSFIVGILPHGIFELPALILGGVVGITVGLRVIFSPEGQTWTKGMILLFKDIGLSLTLIVPLLAIAALLEMTVTPALLKMALGAGFL